MKNTTHDSDLIGHDLEEICEDSDIGSILDGSTMTKEVELVEEAPQSH